MESKFISSQTKTSQQLQPFSEVSSLLYLVQLPFHISFNKFSSCIQWPRLDSFLVIGKLTLRSWASRTWHSTPHLLICSWAPQIRNWTGSIMNISTPKYTSLTRITCPKNQRILNWDCVTWIKTSKSLWAKKRLGSIPILFALTTPARSVCTAIGLILSIETYSFLLKRVKTLQKENVQLTQRFKSLSEATYSISFLKPQLSTKSYMQITPMHISIQKKDIGLWQSYLSRYIMTACLKSKMDLFRLWRWW